MRRLVVTMIISFYAVSGASAQVVQRAVDIGVSRPAFVKGMVQARVVRKDPVMEKVIAPEMLVRVTIGVKGQKPFYSTDVSLKPGGQRLVSAPYANVSAGVVFTVTATAIGVKEMAAADNAIDSFPYRVGTVVVVPGRTPAPAPAPTPPAAPPAASITTSPIVLVGGSASTPTVSAFAAGASVTTPRIVIVGGAQGVPSAAVIGARITTPTLILIGRDK